MPDFRVYMTYNAEILVEDVETEDEAIEVAKATELKLAPRHTEKAEIDDHNIEIDNVEQESDDRAPGEVMVA